NMTKNQYPLFTKLCKNGTNLSRTPQPQEKIAMMGFRDFCFFLTGAGVATLVITSFFHTQALKNFCSWPFRMIRNTLLLWELRATDKKDSDYLCSELKKMGVIVPADVDHPLDIPWCKDQSYGYRLAFRTEL